MPNALLFDNFHVLPSPPCTPAIHSLVVVLYLTPTWFAAFVSSSKSMQFAASDIWSTLSGESSPIPTLPSSVIVNLVLKVLLNAVWSLNSPYPPLPWLAPIILTTSLGCPLPSTFSNVSWPWPVAEAVEDLRFMSAEPFATWTPVEVVDNLIEPLWYNFVSAFATDTKAFSNRFPVGLWCLILKELLPAKVSTSIYLLLLPIKFNSLLRSILPTTFILLCSIVKVVAAPTLPAELNNTCLFEPVTDTVPEMLAAVTLSKYPCPNLTAFVPRSIVPSALGMIFLCGLICVVVSLSISVIDLAWPLTALSANSILISAVVLSTVHQIRPLDPLLSGTPFRWLNATLAFPYPSLTVSATEPWESPATICCELVLLPLLVAKKLKADKLPEDGLYVNPVSLLGLWFPVAPPTKIG